MLIRRAFKNPTLDHRVATGAMPTAARMNTYLVGSVIPTAGLVASGVLLGINALVPAVIIGTISYAWSLALVSQGVKHIDERYDDEGNLMTKVGEEIGKKTETKTLIVNKNDIEVFHYDYARLVETAPFGAGTCKAEICSDDACTQVCGVVYGKFDYTKGLWAITSVLESGGCFMVPILVGQTFTLTIE